MSSGSERPTPPTSVPLSEGVIAALDGRPSVGADEGALQLLTVREDGIVHVTLLSRAEVDTAGGAVFLVLAGRTTPGNLDRTQQATLVVVEATRSSSIALAPIDRIEQGGMVGYITIPIEVREDSLGIPLRPITFSVPVDLPGVERWEMSGALLATLAERFEEGRR